MNTNPMNLELKHTSEPRNDSLSTTDSGKPVLVNVAGKIGIDPKVIVDDLTQHTGGWPKTVSGRLVAPNSKGLLESLNNHTALFAWLYRTFDIDWKGGAGIPKSEFFDFIRGAAQDFADWSDLPHFPPIPKVLYHHPQIDPGNQETLEKFLDFFTPATPDDRELILALLATVFWGGEAGQRPSFVITSNDSSPNRGIGSGKSTLINLIAELSGGQIQIGQQQGIESIKKGILNRANSLQRPRLLVLDNIKSWKFSSADLEALITATEIEGHKLFQGGLSVPNHHVMVMTINQPCLSKDLAKRSIIIELALPANSSNWYDDVVAFVRDNRQAIFADLKGFFGLEQCELPEAGTTRWASWEKAILSRLKNPKQIRELLVARQNALDADTQEAADLSSAFAEGLHDGSLRSSLATKKIGKKIFQFANKDIVSFYQEKIDKTISKRACINKLKNFGLECLKYEIKKGREGVWYFKIDGTRIQQEDLATQPAFVPPEIEFEDSLCFDAAEGNPPQDTSADNT